MQRALWSHTSTAVGRMSPPRLDMMCVMMRRAAALAAAPSCCTLQWFNCPQLCPTHPTMHQAICTRSLVGDAAYISGCDRGPLACKNHTRSIKPRSGCWVQSDTLSSVHGACCRHKINSSSRGHLAVPSFLPSCKSHECSLAVAPQHPSGKRTAPPPSGAASCFSMGERPEWTSTLLCEPLLRPTAAGHGVPADSRQDNTLLPHPHHHCISLIYQ